MLKKPNFHSFVMMALVAFSLVACGKKAQESESIDGRYVNPTLPEIEVELSKQELFCGSDDKSCPNFLAKVAVLNRGSWKYCTGFLIEDDVLVTASNCLPESLKERDASCAGNVTAFFGELRGKPLRVACDRVIESSVNSASQPYLWRSDVAYLKLQKKVRRKNISPSRLGMDDMDKFYTWSIDQIDRFQGIIRKTENCQAIHRSFLNPLSEKNSSPMMTLSGCEFSNGNSGSPVMDYRGRVRGVISAPVHASVIKGANDLRISEVPLDDKKFMYVSNYACSPTYPHEAVLDEYECSKPLDMDAYKRNQNSMSDSAQIFKPSILKVESFINNVNRNMYVKLLIQPTLDEEEFLQLKIQPVCYKNVSTWIGTFPSNPKSFSFGLEAPRVKIKKVMNEYGKIFVKEVTSPNAIKLSFEFNPRVLRNVRTEAPSHIANLNVWTDGEYSFYQNFTNSCPSLL